MANRNVSQLPENTDPQDTDWLLGASGNSPSVLQKMAVGNIKPANSGGGYKFSLPVNENKILNSSGYYFTDNLGADITIDCSNLGIGEHIYWINTSTKNIFFSGFNTIDGITIVANKAIKFGQGTLEFFVKDSNKNIKKISGNHTLDWVPGYVPPWTTINFIEPYTTTTPDIFNYIGTNKLTTAYINPGTNGQIIVTASSTLTEYGVPLHPYLALSRGGSWKDRWRSGDGSPQWIEFNFANYEVSPNRIASAINFRFNNILLQGYSNQNWVDIYNFDCSNTQVSPIFDNEVFYSKIRFYYNNSNIYGQSLKIFGSILG
jgi:hypothetical protein